MLPAAGRVAGELPELTLRAVHLRAGDPLRRDAAVGGQVPGQPDGGGRQIAGHGPVQPADRSGAWLRNAMAGLAVLAAAAAVVSYQAQYQMIAGYKHAPVVAALQAGIPDAAALVFACLGIALALHGRRAVRARALNVAAVGTSVAMNALAAAPGWRALAVWVLPPAAYALASDTLIGVVRAWAIARQRQLGERLADDQATPLAIVGGLLLWSLRLALAPASTLTGFRTWVVAECPVAPGRRAVRRQAVPAITAARRADHGTGRAGAAAGSKTQRFLALAAERHGPLAQVPIQDVSRICTALAPQVGLNTGRRGRRCARRCWRTGTEVPREDRHPAGGGIDRSGFGELGVRPGGGLPRHRVRHARLRLHLRLHPGRGYATCVELWLRWGRLAAYRRSKRIRPSLGTWQRARYPREHSVLLGRAHYRHRLAVPLEEHVLMMAPPRTYKTALLASIILHYPGPVISTTTKADVFALTSGTRTTLGPVHVFNPQSIGNICSTFAWSPIQGCEQQAVAIRRADDFAQAVSQKGVEDGTFWSAKASDYLRAYFHAAALAGADMTVVARWVLGADPDAPEEILRAAGATQWAMTLGELRSEAQKTASTVRMVMSRALSFMADPALAASVLPDGHRGFSIEGFLASRGTLYMIADSEHEDAPVAPLFAAMATEIHYQAELLGQASPGGRLDPPLLMGLDEVTQICPVPLPAWLVDSGGKGIQVISVAHGEAQLAGRWDEHGKQVVLDTSSVKAFLPGITDTKTLDAASKLCGQAAFTEHGKDHASRHEVATADMIRQLPARFALVIRGGSAPVIARLPAAWNDKTYRKARRRGQAIAALTAAIAAAAQPEPAGHGPVVTDDQLPPDPFPPGTEFPWS